MRKARVWSKEGEMQSQISLHLAFNLVIFQFRETWVSSIQCQFVNSKYGADSRACKGLRDWGGRGRSGGVRACGRRSERRAIRRRRTRGAGVGRAMARARVRARRGSRAGQQSCNQFGNHLWLRRSSGAGDDGQARAHPNARHSARAVSARAMAGAAAAPTRHAVKWCE